jgi:Scavenger receptor cysteine-rich domain
MSENLPYAELKLVGGYDYREGRLQVKHNGVWGSICNDAFNDIDAQVACFTLGYG